MLESGKLVKPKHKQIIPCFSYANGYDSSMGKLVMQQPEIIA